MMAMILPWWRDRSVREQWLVGIMLIMLVVIIAWLGIIRPLDSAQIKAETRHSAAVQALGEVRVMTGEIRTAEHRARSAQGLPLVELVSRRAADAGITTQDLQPGGNGRVTVQIEAIKPMPLLRWIGKLEANDGVIVERMNASKNADATVTAALTLRGGDR